MCKYANFENRSVSRKQLPVEPKLAQFRSLGVKRRYACNLGPIVCFFFQIPGIMPEYESFEKWSISRKLLSVERK